MRRCNPAAIGAFLIAIFPLSTWAIDKSQFLSSRVVTKDVLILGGGASGAYAAVRLREDFKKSVVVVEKRDHLVSVK